MKLSLLSETTREKYAKFRNARRNHPSYDNRIKASGMDHDEYRKLVFRHPDKDNSPNNIASIRGMLPEIRKAPAPIANKIFTLHKSISGKEDLGVDFRRRINSTHTLIDELKNNKRLAAWVVDDKFKTEENSGVIISIPHNRSGDIIALPQNKDVAEYIYQ